VVVCVVLPFHGPPGLLLAESAAATGTGPARLAIRSICNLWITNGTVQRTKPCALYGQQGASFSRDALSDKH